MASKNINIGKGILGSMGYDLFAWLAQYHLDANLRPNLSFIVEGQYVGSRGKTIEEGEENHQTYGALVLANGDSLVQRLKKEKIILDLSTPMFTAAGNYDLFASYLSKSKKRDGAFVFDGKNETMTRVSRYANYNSELMQEVRENFARYMPANFIYEAAAMMTPKDYDNDVGTKTDLAMVLPVSHTKADSSVHAYQIKATAHSRLGFGKVAHFGPDGLIEELFFRYAPESKGPFVVSGQNIEAVHRKYERGADDRLYLASERVVGPTLEEYFKNQR